MSKVSHTSLSEYAKMEPLLKWPGGKEQELKHIIPNLPSRFINYYEPFVGGGAVYTAVSADRYFINDKSGELISLYRSIIDDNRQVFFETTEEIIHNWNLLTIVTETNRTFFINSYKQYSAGILSDTSLKNIIFEFILNNTQQFNGMFRAQFNFNIEHFIQEIKTNLIRKMSRMKVIEQQKEKLCDQDIVRNIETALKSAFYMHFRHIYNRADNYNLNTAFKSAVFLFMRNYAYSGMFRYNSKGEFNVPYGGMAYNRKNFTRKVDFLKGENLCRLLQNSEIASKDFETFLLENNPAAQDFIFLDPPYDSDFSTYAQNVFSRNDQERLANYLLTQCAAQWMMIIKNTEFIDSLYANKGLNIQTFDKKYLVSFMNRNDKKAQHLLITNY